MAWGCGGQNSSTLSLETEKRIFVVKNCPMQKKLRDKFMEIYNLIIDDQCSSEFVKMNRCVKMVFCLC